MAEIKISSLPVTTTLSANDRVVILSNPSTAANVSTITASNFANGLISGNVFPVANSSQYGIVQVDGTTIISTNGIISASANIGNFQFANNNINLLSPNNTNVYINPTGNGSVVVSKISTGNVSLGGNIIPSTNNIYTLGNSSIRFNSIWVGGNSVVFSDQNSAYPDQTLTVSNGIFYIATSSNVNIQSTAGFRVGNFLLQNNAITLSNTQANISIGTTGSTGGIIFYTPLYNRDISNTYNLFSVDPNGIVIITSNSSAVGNISAFQIIGSISGQSQSPNNTGVMVHITGLHDNPSRIYNDSFGNTYPAYIGRAARGFANGPTQSLSGDITNRIGSNPYSTTGYASLSTTRMDFVNQQDQTDVNKGSQIQFWTTANNSNTVAKRLTINETGLKLTTGNIVFSDNTTQTTAFNSNSAVTNISVGTGLTQSGNTGNVSISATGIQSVVGTNNQVIVNNVGQNITLSLPQSIATNSTVTFGTLTVNNFTVTGISTIANSTYITNKVFNLAYNSNSSAQIDQGGFTLGNTSSAYTVSFLYSLANNAWNTDGAGLITTGLVTTQNSYFTDIFISNGANFGTAYAGYDYPQAIIQVDGNYNNYMQMVQQNHSNGINASTDYVAVNDLGSDGSYFIDMGINSSTYNGAGAGWTVSGPNDAYLYNANGNLTIGTSTPNNVISFHTGGTYANNIRLVINDYGIVVSGNVTANSFIGNLTGTANNTNFVGTVSAANVVSNAQLIANLASYQTLSGLASNVIILTSNSANFVGTLPAANVVSNAQLIANLANYQTTADLSANVLVLTSNSTNYVGTVSAANVVSNAQLIANLASYQTLSGLAANVATLISNSALYIGTLPAANVVSNAQLQANLANYANTSQLAANLGNYQTTAGLAANVVTLTSNSANFIGTLPAANVVSNAQLIANLAYYVTGSAFTANLLNYQTSAGLSANVLTLSSNATNYLGNSSGTIANIASWITSNSATAYSNAVANAAAIYQTSAGLSANVLTLTANAAGYLSNSSGTLSNIASWITGNSATAYSNAVANAAAIYQTSAGLSANVLTLSSNNASYLGNVAASSYINTSGSYTISGVHTHNANIVISTSAGISANGSFGTNGQYLASNGTSVYWANQYPEMLVYSIDADRSISTQNTAQSLFGVGVTLATNTKYRYKIYGTVYKSNSSFSSSGALNFAITNSTANAVLGRSYYVANPCAANTSQPTVMPAYQVSQSVNTGFSSLYTITNSNTGTTWYSFIIDGILDVTTGGTLNPQIGFTHANGTIGNTSVLQAGATMEIWPIGNATSNAVIGTWA